MKDIPDILGMELEKAKALLNSEGLDFIVTETKPTKKESVIGVFRIIKVNNNSKGLILTVCKI